MFDPTVLFPPDQFIKIKNVPIFDEHESTTANGKPRKITTEMLEKLARNCNRKFEELGAATPLSLGHTVDGKDETDQPPVVGWAVNFKVQPLLRTGRDALFCDWYIRRKHEHVIEEYPNRSIELWPSRNDISPIALLKSTAPERDLPILKYHLTTGVVDEPYQYVFTPPSNQESLNSMTNNVSPDSVVQDAVVGETDSVKKLAAEVSDLKSQFESFMQMFMQLLEQGDDEGEGDDKTDASDLFDEDVEDKDKDDDKEEDEDKDVEDDKADLKDERKDDKPEKMNAGYAGGDNTYIPSTDTEKKTKMSRTELDKVQYERVVAEATAKATEAIRKENEVLRKENHDIKLHFNRMQAEKAVEALEREHNIDFGDKAEREDEVQLFTDMLTEDKTGKSFDIHFNKVVKKYKRKEATAPDSNGVEDLMRFSRTDLQPGAFQSARDIEEFVRAYTNDTSLTPEKYSASKNGVKK